MTIDKITNRLGLYTLLLIVGLAACDQEQNYDLGDIRTVSHPSGFSVTIPEEWQSTIVEDRLSTLGVLQGNPRDSRHTIIHFLEADVARDELVRTRILGGERVSYEIVSMEGGMGGPEYGLIAERPLCDETLRLEQWTQREFGQPDFGVAWAILASAECQR